RYTEADGTVNYYYAVCNSRGDVEGIYNGAGELRAHYTYDSWGNVISITDQNGKEITSSTHIGILNPIRYRGYYYDAETGMYYVGSRYYDPQVGRWINADDTAYLGAGETLVSYNLFAYCSNNPVTGYDLDGTWDWGNFSKGSGWVATGVVAVAVGVSVLTCGVAAPAMMAVAAVTVTAGVATAVNGVSEIGEAATGHNFMRDDVFRGNSTAYNAYAYSTAITAQI
ncbi:MAG: RHS repeat-associated core domain-containing protein, partial [Oscillospiraceae bacterium]|nr:RHS repeat-associated core domain-containing protein [Oscillospiraceae bacterium]